MCANCDELEERVAFLESELGLQQDSYQLDVLKRATGLQTAPARVLRMLYEAKGRPLSNWLVIENLPANSLRQEGHKLAAVYVSKIRRVLGKRVIINVWGEGYRLSSDGMALVSAILQPRVAEAA